MDIFGKGGDEELRSCELLLYIVLVQQEMSSSVCKMQAWLHKENIKRIYSISLSKLE